MAEYTVSSSGIIEQCMTLEQRRKETLFNSFLDCRSYANIEESIYIMLKHYSKQQGHIYPDFLALNWSFSESQCKVRIICRVGKNYCIASRQVHKGNMQEIGPTITPLRRLFPCRFLPLASASIPGPDAFSHE